MAEKAAPAAGSGSGAGVTAVVAALLANLGIAVAKPSSPSTSSTQASLQGIETPHPRMPRARIPATAAARSVVVNALYTKSRSSSA